MNFVILLVSAGLLFAGVAPYLLDVIKKRTKPRVVSWFNWSLLSAIATVAAFSDKQYPSAILTLAATVATALVGIFGLRYGDRKLDKFDVLCQIGAVLGVVLWVAFDSPQVAIICTVGIDFIAGLPTLRHSWQKPKEETPIAFVTGALGSLLSFAAIHKPQVIGLVYPFYLLVMNLILFIIIVSRRRTV